ncbi:MAG TPA: Holliday junction branch migration protein RuvA [Bacteroidia bacterium]|nr:Holliday junction branch migration protein RuvA [Bacteroidia bacterium]
MYSYICGKVRSVSPTSVLIDNQGMGFTVQISLHTYSAIKDLTEVQLFTHCVIKVESQAVSHFAIYGFSNEQERGLFLDLISVSGVGNNTAQLILSSFEPSDLIHAIATGNVGALQKVKGIGSKTAQRVIIDLKDKILKSAGDLKIPMVAGNTIKEESLSALVTLGFTKMNAEKAVDKALKTIPEGATVEKIIKAALGYLAS